MAAMRLMPLLIVCACVLSLGRFSAPLAATRHYAVGDRLMASQLHATDGNEKVFSFENPSIIILWSTWSPAAITALTELLDGAPQGGIRWQIVPINVDAPTLNSSDTSRVNSAARLAGWNGPVWYDRGYRIMDTWGVFSVPTVAFTALGGAIDDIEHDWSASIRDKLFVLYFGAATDSFPGMETSVASPQCRAKAESARKLWRMGKKPSAIAVMQTVADSCAGLPNDLARLADWRWSMGDSSRHRTDIEKLVESNDRNAWTLAAQASLADRERDDSVTVALCEQAIALDSAYFPAWILLAERSQQNGDSLTTNRAYARARELNRLDSRVLSLGSRLAVARGEIVESVRLMRMAVEARLRRAGL